ncbi:MAG: hypothetical protein AB7S69_13110 [Salinivirgaceae bacterium]
MKRLVILIIIFLPFILLGQSNSSNNILNKIENQLKKDTSLTDYYMQKSYYKSGNIKQIFLFFNYKDDTIDRYICYDRYYWFLESGEITMSQSINNEKYNIPDTISYISKNGEILSSEIYVTVDSSEIDKKINTIDYDYGNKYIFFINESGYTLIEGCSQIYRKEFYVKYHNSYVKIQPVNKNTYKYSYYTFDLKKEKYKKEFSVYKYFYVPDLSAKDIHKLEQKGLLVLDKEINRKEIKYETTDTLGLIRLIQDYLEYFSKYYYLTQRAGGVHYTQSYYLKNNEIINCHIAFLRDPRKPTPESVLNLLLLAYNGEGHTVLIANEVDGYRLIGNFTNHINKDFVAFRNGTFKIFVEQINSGNFVLYKKPELFTGDALCYYIYDKAQQKVFVISPNRYYKKEYDFAELGSAKRLKVEVLMTDEDIRSFLVTLPIIDEETREKISSGKFPIWRIEHLFK